MLSLTRNLLNDFEFAAQREWLVTNGLGGFACGSLAGAATRRYHGLLVAALRPPVERTVLVAKLDAAALYRGERFELGANEFADGTIAPQGFVHLDSFRLEGTLPVWTWIIGDAVLEQRIWMHYGANTTYVQFTLVRASDPVALELAPLCTYRDYHAHHRGERYMHLTEHARGVQVDAFWGARPYRLLSERGAHCLAPQWWWNVKHRAESERGLDDLEDLFRPALFTMTLAPGASDALVLTAESEAPISAVDSLARERTRQQELLRTAHSSGPAQRVASPLNESMSQLVLAADQFIVERRAADAPTLTLPRSAGEGTERDSTSNQSHAYDQDSSLARAAREGTERASTRTQSHTYSHDGSLPRATGEAANQGADLLTANRQPLTASGRHTIIAGYPWFSDWGRDTMIALPGLTLSTGRHDVAASILRTFARYVSEGMLPNRFPDAGETPEYNTVDATLWWFVATDEYVRATDDRTLLDALYPALRSVVRWHQRGTRYGIRVDERDGLLRAGEPGVQLTWMDAKIGDWVVTPRIGKPVEINALWFNALAIMRDFAHRLGDCDAAREYGAAAEQVARAFNARFWSDELGYLFDVIDGPEGDDPSLRPNQLFAVSLRHALLDNGRAKAVVDVSARELWTPVGMRSLARSASSREARAANQSHAAAAHEPHYVGRYTGGPRERDAVYHQGTVWSWLLGPFVLAHYQVYGDADAALEYLNGVAAHLRDACIGQVSEIFDGDAPFTARGCFAQAWGVAEILRAWSEVNASEHPASRREARRTATRG